LKQATDARVSGRDRPLPTTVQGFQLLEHHCQEARQ
jgi:hypothetical protein